MKLHSILAGTVALVAAGGAARGLGLPSSPVLEPATTIMGALLSPHVADNGGVAGLHPDLKVVEVDGYAAAGDGGRHRIVYDAANACGAGGHPAASTAAAPTTCINSTWGSGAGSWNIDWASVNFEASAALYGAQFKGPATSAQDTAAVQAALRSGQQRVRLPTLGGSFFPNACMGISVNSQHIQGDTDTLGGLAIIVTSALAQGSVPDCKGIFFETQNFLNPFIEALNVSFAQPDQTDPAQMIRYPPLYFLQNGGRFRLVNDVCANATVCVDMRGNSGGAYIQDFQFSAYRYGIDIDGSLDTVRINNPHWFPYGMTGNQQAAFFSQGSSRPIGIRAGRMDDMVMTGGLFIGGLGFQGYSGTGAAYNGVGGNAGAVLATITGTDFDTFSGVQLLGGSVNCASCTFSLGAAAARGIDVQGISGPYFVSQFTCAGCSMYNQSATAPMVTQQAGSGSNSSVNFSGSILVESLADTTFFLNKSGSLVLSGNTFIRPVGQTLKAPTIDVEGGRAVVTGNYARDSGGRGTFIKIASDDFHIFANNSLPGWSASYPPIKRGSGGGTVGIYSPNALSPAGPT